MGVLGVVACQVLEHELAHLLASDAEVGRITVVEDATSARLVELLANAGCSRVHLVPCVESFRAEPPERLEVLVRVLSMGLHRSRRLLRRFLLAAARNLAPHCHALLLTYGLCAGTPSLQGDPALQHRPVFCPRDHGEAVDDCVAMLLGGRDLYLAEQRQVPGTFFVTPGWSCHWSDLVRKAEGAAPGTKKLDLAGGGLLERLFSGYQRSLLVVNPCMAREEMRRNVSELDRRLGLRSEARTGTLDLLEDAWTRARDACLEIHANDEGHRPG